MLFTRRAIAHDIEKNKLDSKKPYYQVDSKGHISDDQKNVVATKEIIESKKDEPVIVASIDEKKDVVEEHQILKDVHDEDTVSEDDEETSEEDIEEEKEETLVNEVAKKSTVKRVIHKKKNHSVVKPTAVEKKDEV